MAATHWRGALAPEMSSPSAVTGEVWQLCRLRHARSHRRRMMSGRDGRGMACSERVKQEEMRTVADVSQPAVLQAFQRRHVVPAQPAACVVLPGQSTLRASNASLNTVVRHQDQRQKPCLQQAPSHTVAHAGPGARVAPPAAGAVRVGAVQRTRCRPAH